MLVHTELNLLQWVIITTVQKRHSSPKATPAFYYRDSKPCFRKPHWELGTGFTKAINMCKWAHRHLLSITFISEILIYKYIYIYKRWSNFCVNVGHNLLHLRPLWLSITVNYTIIQKYNVDRSSDLKCFLSFFLLLSCKHHNFLKMIFCLTYISFTHLDRRQLF